MKKTLALMCVGIGVLAAATTYADEMPAVEVKIAGGGVSDMYMPPYYGGLNLEEMLSASKSSVNDKILKEFFSVISQNSVTEDWTYNAAHYGTKAVNYNLFVPTTLQSKVKSVTVKFEPETYNGGYYPMYDSATPSTKEQTSASGIPVEVVFDTKNLEGEYLTGQVMIEKSKLSFTKGTTGQSYTAQAYLNLTDGSVVPYSQDGYIFIYGDDVEAVKQELSNAYYASGENYGYVDVQKMLNTAFERVEAKTKSSSEYVAVLKKVGEKATAKQEKIQKNLEEIAKSVKDETTFNAAVSVYGAEAKKYDIITNAIYFIQTEIDTRGSSSIIDELFE